MDLLQAVLYGIVQGLGEFLPISSTAHIILTPWIFGWKDPGSAFDIALHMGTLLTVAIFFWKDWVRLIKAGFTDIKSKEGRLFWFIMLACIPGGIFGILIEKEVETTFRNPLLIGIMLIIMGIVLYLADRFSKSEGVLINIGFKRSFIIGVSQALAVIPGVSRSGITMAAGRILRLNREDAARFTFLLSTPFIFLSGVYKAKDLISVPIDALPFVVAIVTAGAVGALSIKFILQYLNNKGFGIFAIYRVILGTIIITVTLLR